MPTQRFEGKRVEERVGEGERERGREKEHTHAGEEERERERESTGTRDRNRERQCFDSSFYMFLPPPGPALCKFGLGWSAVCST